jgi:tetratricopeptide (TPR) repeat protein
MQCLDENSVQGLAQGQLTAGTEIAAHLESCTDCRKLVSWALQSPSESRAGPAELTPATPATPNAAPPGALASNEQLPRGTAVGRYLLLERIGAGGMGVVYLAYDPDLDRRIAVKLIRAAGTEAMDADRQQRFPREARAMARPQHPEVIAVYDVGSALGSVFIAMEYVDGTTLRGWLSAEPRTWRAVLAMFVRVGHGLAAAHATGLVHRDFKPDNVLVGKDDRVRVTDFGLARLLEFDAPDAAPPVPMDQSIDRISRLTKTGGLIGSPGYMAPEQISGAQVDARADVFSFCVALYEALYGERPFAGETLRALHQQIVDDDVRPPRAGSQVPAWLRQVLLHGLRGDKEKRTPSIDVLLTELGRDPTGRRRRVALVAAALAVACGGGLAIRSIGRAQRQICPAEARRDLAGIWDDGRRAALQAAMAQSKFSDAAFNSRRATQLLDDYTSNWSSMRSEACEARRTGAAPLDLLGRRDRCLEERLTETKDLIGFLFTDPEMPAHASRILGGLAPLEVCGNDRLLQSDRAPGDLVSWKKALGELRTLEQAEALFHGGRYREAIAAAQTAAAALRPLGYRALEGRAEYLLALAQDYLGDHASAAKSLERATVAAEAGGRDDVAGLAWSTLAGMTGTRDHDLDRAFSCGEHARASIERLGGDQRIESNLEAQLGLALTENGRAKDALPHLQKSVDLIEHAAGRDNDLVAHMLEPLGYGLLFLHRAPEAAAVFEREKALLLETVGNLHPRYALLLGNLAVAMSDQGKDQEALALLREALPISVAWKGADHLETGEFHDNLGDVELKLGLLEDAERDKRRALVIYQDKVAGTLLAARGAAGLAAVLVDQKKYAEGQKLLEAALPMLQVQHADPDDLGIARFRLAQALWETGGKSGQRKASALVGQAESGLRAIHDDKELARISKWKSEHL